MVIELEVQGRISKAVLCPHPKEPSIPMPSAFSLEGHPFMAGGWALVIHGSS